jgi:hypothetical protein
MPEGRGRQSVNHTSALALFGHVACMSTVQMGGGAMVGDWVNTENTHTHGARQLIIIYITNSTAASGTLYFTCPWLQLVPHTGWRTHKGIFLLDAPGLHAGGLLGNMPSH